MMLGLSGLPDSTFLGLPFLISCMPIYHPILEVSLVALDPLFGPRVTLPQKCLPSQIFGRQPSVIHFSSAALHFWHSLPDSVRSSPIIGILKGRLFRYLFDLENNKTWCYLSLWVPVLLRCPFCAWILITLFIVFIYRLLFTLFLKTFYQSYYIILFSPYFVVSYCILIFVFCFLYSILFFLSVLFLYLDFGLKIYTNQSIKNQCLLL